MKINLETKAIIEYTSKVRTLLRPVKEEIFFMNPLINEVSQGPESGEIRTDYRAIVKLTKSEFYNALKELDLSTNTINYRFIQPVNNLLKEPISSLLPRGKRDYAISLSFPGKVKGLNELKIKINNISY